MTVLFLVSKARDPRWLELLGLKVRTIAGGPPLTSQEVTDKHIDTRILQEASEREPLVTGPDRSSFSETLDPNADDLSPIERAWLHGWRTIFEKLPLPDRAILFHGLRDVRHRRVVGNNSWAATIASVDHLWREYLRSALEPVENLPEQEHIAWRIVLDHVERRWTDDWLPRLNRWSNNTTVEEPDRNFAGELQSILDPCALQAVRDDALLNRAPEREIWFRLFEELAAVSATDLRNNSIGPTGYVQLYDQPRSYRGRVVTVRGIALQASFVAETQAAFAIDGYYVITLRPAGGPDRPIIAYTLELPAGFPEVKKATDGSTTRLHEEIEITGYFFKRMPYLAQDGVNRAPLVLARVPIWEPSIGSESAYSTSTTLYLASIIAAVTGIGFAVWIFRRSYQATTEMRNAVPLPDRIEPWDDSSSRGHHS